MKMLAVFVLAVLGWSLAEGRSVSVCELTGQLRSAAANQTVLNGSVLDNVLAKVVCYTKALSNLNTSLETQVTVVGHGNGHNHNEVGEGGNSEENHGGSGAEHHSGGAGGERHSGEAGAERRPGGARAERHSGERHRRSSEGRDSRGRGHGSSASAPPPPQNCTLYGLFQLSSCQACNDSVTPTTNICGLSCSNLVDDDITNDVACLLKVIAPVANPNAVWQELKESPGRFSKIQSSQCSNVTAYMC